MKLNNQKLQNFFKRYIEFSSIIGSVVLLLIFLNLFLYFYFENKGMQGESLASEPLLIEQKYPDIHGKLARLGVVEPEKLLRETYGAGLIFEPFTGFREKPREGKWVNIENAGFRRGNGKQVWPIDKEIKNIFYFGGSTTFGYGVMDSQTISSFTEVAINNKNVKVYNFGRGNYYSTPERILFEQLLMKGHIPEVAIFVDGLNDFYFSDIESYQEEVNAEYWNGDLEKICKPEVDKWISSIPMVRLTESIQKRLHLNKKNTTSSAENQNVAKDQTFIDKVITRYLWNKKTIEAIGKLYGVKVMFIWQPVPNYRYDLNYHDFKSSGFGKHALSGYGYHDMHKIWKSGALGKNFIWLANLAENWTETVYIDQVHYSAGFNKKIAETIANYLIEM